MSNALVYVYFAVYLVWYILKDIFNLGEVIVKFQSHDNFKTEIKHLLP